MTCFLGQITKFFQKRNRLLSKIAIKWILLNSFTRTLWRNLSNPGFYFVFDVKRIARIINIATKIPNEIKMTSLM